jgi:hypothetical protein
MKKLLVSLLLGLALCPTLFATNPPDEGMWLPMLIDRLNYVDMQKMGLHLTAEELYSVNNASLKDAIVGLGNKEHPSHHFCTAEVISDQGLLLTNHHCGFEAIQAQSSVEQDYLTNGFWAYSQKEELRCEGVTASFLVRMENVTDKVLAGVTDKMTEDERNYTIEKASKKLENNASEKGKYAVDVIGFYNNNEFYLFVYTIYKDIRLCGAPPSAIGKFGGDTDNWMWPRHTGDFSMLRIYSAPDGSPAEYSDKNIPLKPKYHLPISLKGVKKDDFSMIYGYPAKTERYKTSYDIQERFEYFNPITIAVRTQKLALLKQDMEADPKVKLQYASKYSESANYWKNYYEEDRGLQRFDVYNKKKEIENAFNAWANADNARKAKYGGVLKLLADNYAEEKKYKINQQYLEEAVFEGPEFIYFAFGAFQLSMKLKAQNDVKDKTAKATFDADIKIMADEFKPVAEKFFKDYNMPTDKKLFIALLKMYYDNVPKEQLPDIFANILVKKFKGNFNLWADDVYSKSVFVDKTKLMAFLDKPAYKVISTDPGFSITQSMAKCITGLYNVMDALNSRIDKGNRLFIAGLREMNPNKKYYPDANSTMRMTYGRALDYEGDDAISYNYYTTLKGVMEKEDPSNDEFIVPAKLKQLYNAKDYGRYGQNGEMHVCFTTDQDITGGNSGSPCINGDGQLVGIAFDGNWESVVGNFYFEPKKQRTICVDIRYVLFIIEKYAGAKNLIDEMTYIQ